MTDGPFITFFKSNDIDDRGRDVALSDVVSQFWASEDAQNWLTRAKDNGSVIPLERLALVWVADNIGDWGSDDGPPAWPDIYHAIFDARPWKDKDN